MTPLRLILSCLLALGLISWAIAKRVTSSVGIPVPLAQANIVDPYDAPALSRYKLFRDAVAVHDVATLISLSSANDYLAFQAAVTLARDTSLSSEERYQHMLRAETLRYDEPLDRQGKRAFKLELARLAESAARTQEALAAYEEALPEDEALNAIKRLQTDPYQQANTFLNNRMYQDSLDALDGRLAPSLEALAYRRLGDYDKALDAYERWLVEVPSSSEARLGKAWTQFALGNNEEARANFSNYASPDALYGQALALKRLGDIDGAVSLLQQTNDVADIWLAAGYLEDANRITDALPLYLRLARGSSKLADDAAYRAYLLASRLGDATTLNEAQSYVKPDSFFALKLGRNYQLPALQELALPELAVNDLAKKLNMLGQRDAALGELRFALRESTDPNTKLSLAQQLYELADFRQAQRTATLLLPSMPDNAAAWRLAYPQAYATEVLNYAQAYALEPALIWAIMRQESAFFPTAVSRSNAKGLMQVIPSTWDWLAELQQEAPGNPFDPATNIRYGAFYLNWMRNYFSDYNGDLELMIVSYNRGQGYIRRLYETDYVNQNKDELYREIDALETREYLQSVTLNYLTYKALYSQN